MRREKEKTEREGREGREGKEKDRDGVVPLVRLQVNQ